MTIMTIKKKFLFFLISFPTLIFSQSVSDIVDFSIDNPLGTARFESMGGAFGALGGDLSAININPAGSAVFNTNQYVLSFSNNEKKINTNFFNSSSRSDLLCRKNLYRIASAYRCTKGRSIVSRYF